MKALFIILTLGLVMAGEEKQIPSSNAEKLKVGHQLEVAMSTFSLWHTGGAQNAAQFFSGLFAKRSNERHRLKARSCRMVMDQISDLKKLYKSTDKIDAYFSAHPDASMREAFSGMFINVFEDKLTHILAKTAADYEDVFEITVHGNPIKDYKTNPAEIDLMGLEIRPKQSGVMGALYTLGRTEQLRKDLKCELQNNGFAGVVNAFESEEDMMKVIMAYASLQQEYDIKISKEKSRHKKARLQSELTDKLVQLLRENMKGESDLLSQQQLLRKTVQDEASIYGGGQLGKYALISLVLAPIANPGLGFTLLGPGIVHAIAQGKCDHPRKQGTKMRKVYRDLEYRKFCTKVYIKAAVKGLQASCGGFLRGFNLRKKGAEKY